VIELNGAVEFRPVYSFPARDIFAEAMAALAGTEVEAVADAAAR
jgi:hypothetical protein